MKLSSRWAVLFLCAVAALSCGLSACGDETQGSPTSEPNLATLSLDYVSEIQDLGRDIIETAGVQPETTPDQLAAVSDELLRIQDQCRSLREEIATELPADFAARKSLVAAATLSADVAGDLAVFIESFRRLQLALGRAEQLAAAELQRLEEALQELLAELEKLETRLQGALASLVDALRTLESADNADPQRVDDLQDDVRQTQDDADESVRGLRDVAERERELAPPAGPVGPLEASGVGPVELGMTPEQVEELFGAPDRKEDVNFSASPTPPQVDWIWSYPDGDLRLNFETVGETVTGYSSETAELQTTSGVAVGDSFAPIEERYGEQLVPAPIGVDAFVLSEGEPGTYPALTFSLQGDTIIAIRGGEPQSAGE